jgi:hypothetical protein
MQGTVQCEVFVAIAPTHKHCGVRNTKLTTSSHDSSRVSWVLVLIMPHTLVAAATMGRGLVTGVSAAGVASPTPTLPPNRESSPRLTALAAAPSGTAVGRAIAAVVGGAAAAAATAAAVLLRAGSPAVAAPAGATAATARRTVPAGAPATVTAAAGAPAGARGTPGQGGRAAAVRACQSELKATVAIRAGSGPHSVGFPGFRTLRRGEINQTPRDTVYIKLH